MNMLLQEQELKSKYLTYLNKNYRSWYTSNIKKYNKIIYSINLLGFRTSNDIRDIYKTSTV